MTDPTDATATSGSPRPDRQAVAGTVAWRSAFLPILLTTLAVTAWFAFQTLQLVRERQQLEAARAALAPQELAATKLRTALDQLATATAKLAGEGNASARAIVEQLRNRGVTINPAASAPR